MEFKDKEIFVGRRKALFDRIVEHAGLETVAAILFFGAHENERYRFRQNSYFYYFFGITEPASVGVLYQDGTSSLYLPDFGGTRSVWVDEQVSFLSDPQKFGLTNIKPLGRKQQGYASGGGFSPEDYENLIQNLRTKKDDGDIVGIWGSGIECASIFPLVEGLNREILGGDNIVNVVGHADALRRIKSSVEIMAIQKAIDITIDAQRLVPPNLKLGLREYEVQAVIEGEFLRQGALQCAFPSIVGGGVKSTVLHYVNNDRYLENGDLVVIDVGAEYGYYAADLTRTYPVSGKFSVRQREIYQLVLDAQTYACEQAKPGMFLRNAPAGERSLHFLVVEFFKKQGMEKYFPHGLGHFMGLDVHDVGDYLQPLQAGDVFTIEPGLYLRDEAIGVRIEDDYLMTDQGAICLSAQLPKKPDDIEGMFR